MGKFQELKGSKTKMTGYFLLLTSQHKCQVVEGVIDDGTAFVGEKDFSIDGTEPFLFKKKSLIGGDSYYPFYIVKWDDPNPKTLQDIKNLDEIDIDSYTLNPRMLRKLAETRLFEGLFKHSGDTGLFSGENMGRKIAIFVAVGITGLIIYLIQTGAI